MFELSKILVALDHSRDSGWAALAISQFLAKAYRANLTSFHVVPEMSKSAHRVLFPYAALGEDLAEFEQELINAARRDMRQILRRDDEESCAHPEDVVHGPVREGVLAETVRIGPDLLVLATHGDGGAIPRHLGSTAAFIAESWEGPVLLTRPERVSSKPFSQITVATDLSPGSESVVEAALGLAIHTDTPINVVTCLVDLRPLDRGGLLRGVVRIDPDQINKKGRANANRQWQRVAAGLTIPFPQQKAVEALKLAPRVEFGDPEVVLNRIIGEQEDTLLVVGRGSPRAKFRVGLGRTALNLASRVPAHCLLVPIEAQAGTA